MQSPQEASVFFFVPLAAAYSAACGAWMLYNWRRPDAWPREGDQPSDRPWLDLSLSLLAVMAIIAIGQLYQAGWLLPTGGGWPGRLNWNLNNLLIYSPPAVTLLLRRQRPSTAYLSGAGLGQKIAVGGGLGLLSIFVYLLFRGDIAMTGAVFTAAVSPANLANFLPVFLEGAAMAFVFVRLRWACGLPIALLLPAVLFAAAHIPRQWQGGLTALEMAAFFAFNVALVPAILYTVHRSRDVIWIGIVHYLMDVASGAFAA